VLTLTLRRLATHSHIEMNSVDVDFDLTGGKTGLPLRTRWVVPTLTLRNGLTTQDE